MISLPERLTQKEALQILHDANIQVVMRPMAVMPADEYELSIGEPRAHQDMDIIKAAHKILLQRKIVGDIFAAKP